ncbi:unnamed protein product [Linum tenue]|uniref:Protein RFT1 homolog n=1 Tax=Linum tenue TaxID=586396 RepID=A0AAV0PU12_9ROSI|nr:unnamed protein product [Linum tenue]
MRWGHESNRRGDGAAVLMRNKNAMGIRRWLFLLDWEALKKSNWGSCNPRRDRHPSDLVPATRFWHPSDLLRLLSVATVGLGADGEDEEEVGDGGGDGQELILSRSIFLASTIIEAVRFGLTLLSTGNCLESYLMDRSRLRMAASKWAVVGFSVGDYFVSYLMNRSRLGMTASKRAIIGFYVLLQ